MDQIKIGNTIKELRKKKELTQQQIADQFMVSRKSVSRWETGRNLPDLALLIEIADFFQVELRELLNGEIKNSVTDQNEKETIAKVAEYSFQEKMKVMQRMHWLFWAGFIASVVHLVLMLTEQADSFFGGLCLGIMSGMLFVGIIITSRFASKIQKMKQNFLYKWIHERKKPA